MTVSSFVLLLACLILIHCVSGRFSWRKVDRECDTVTQNVAVLNETLFFQHLGHRRFPDYKAVANATEIVLRQSSVKAPKQQEIL